MRLSRRGTRRWGTAGAVLAVVAAELVGIVTAPSAQAAISVTGVHVNGPSRTYTLASGNDAKVLFEGVPQQTVTVKITAVTFPGSCDLKVSLLRPDGTTLVGPTCSGAAVTLPATALTTSGLFGVLLDGQGTAAGSATVAVTGTGRATITPTIGSLAVTVPAGATADWYFRAEQGDFLYAEFGTTNASGSFILSDATGTNTYGQRTSFTGWTLKNLYAPTSGVVRLRIVAPGDVGLTGPLTVSRGKDLVIPTTSGATQSLSLPLKGQHARLVVNAVAGERIFWTLPSNTFQRGVTVSLLDPTGATVCSRTLVTTGLIAESAQDCTSQDVYIPPATVSGAWTVLVEPRFWSTGSATARIDYAADPMLTPGVPRTVTRGSAGQGGYFTVARRRGQRILYTVTGNTISGVFLSVTSVNKPPAGQAFGVGGSGILPLGNLSGDATPDFGPTEDPGPFEVWFGTAQDSHATGSLTLTLTLTDPTPATLGTAVSLPDGSNTYYSVPVPAAGGPLKLTVVAPGSQEAYVAAWAPGAAPDAAAIGDAVIDQRFTNTTTVQLTPATRSAGTYLVRVQVLNADAATVTFTAP